ncbi:endonuclease III domain-containing protein [Xanthobacter dioxanivorans]|uniref:Endonuclease III domain-containing protein n=1 Tax=Xanthobacter dioxanivorans TaxID=2528964 RepID=A0A974PSH2_9HYPH|nr:endonuclease III domain-containing protein [Xanthobacter dioxanivorans]QRG08924.1 endonuclease III domain-containing protein [Xanthobacter dioxanivorans]
MHTSGTSSQRILSLSGDRLHSLDLPAADEIVDGWNFRWGEADTPMTPAYWAAQAWMWALDAPNHYRLGNTLEEELLACMLGGYGIPAEVGLAAYERLRETLHASPDALTDHESVMEALSTPLTVGGRIVRYRFAKQKAGYVTAAFRALSEIDRSLADAALRDELMTLRGIGPKTASWVVRNLRQSDEVAILDVHIHRAGRSLGIFEPNLTAERHYLALEAAYLRFARAIRTAPSILDSVMWNTMRQLPGRTAGRRLEKSHSQLPTQLSLAI